ncbi:MAG: energy transducer TonB [Terriglobales bacterium]
MGLFFLGAGIIPQHAVGQGELTREVKAKALPVYSDLARCLSIRGTVETILVASPNGNLKDARVGGNPILVNAAPDAVKKWKFEPEQDETTGTVEFDFEPNRPVE